MQDASQENGQIAGLQEQRRELRRSLARIDRQIAKEQDQLRQVENRLTALSRKESLAA
jgi:septal ring factor EnvC (AmiA/AmiB activator)